MDNKQKIIEPSQPQPASGIQSSPTPTVVSVQPDQTPGNKKSDKLIKVVVIILSIGSIGFIVLAAAIIIPFAGMFNKCNTAASKAQASADGAVKQLNALTLLDGKPSKASPEVSGDCIDTRSHDGNAIAHFDVQDTLGTFDGQLSTNLTSRGYTLTTPLHYNDTSSFYRQRASASYQKGNDRISVTYKFKDYSPCPQDERNDQPCDSNDISTLLQHEINTVEVRLYPANGSHPNQ